MEPITNFLTFKTFISPYALIIFYYLGVIAIPLFSNMLYLSLKNKYIKYIKMGKDMDQKPIEMTNVKFKPIFVIAYLFMLISAEIIWRMMFEFLIAYLQIRDTLVLMLNS